jgi:predicted transcriptional regulator of viral defense system
MGQDDTNVTRRGLFAEKEAMALQPRDLPDHFLANGRYAFTLGEAAAALGTKPAATRKALARLLQRKEVFSPTKGLYVAVPPDYRSWGVLPGEWFVDAMMRHLRRPYYIALLSAARLHGASHQAPQVFQVMTPAAPLRDRDLGRVRLRFYTSKHVTDDKTEQVTVPTGYAVVSSKETTVVDLITHYRGAGGYGNVATIVSEIGELSGAELARAAARRGRATVRRTGWFVQNFGAVDELEALRQAARVDLGEPTPLDPAGPRRGKTDPDWHVRANTTVEADL